MSHHVIPDYIKERAKELRKNQTRSEKILWDTLKNRQLSGIKRYRQFPIMIGIRGYNRWYIADFRSAELQLVVEIDGGYHDNKIQQEYDTLRTSYLAGTGIHVIRFTNEEIYENMMGVLQKIVTYTDSPLL